jgi:hypothetical protein
MWSHPFLLGKEGKKVREKSRWKLVWRGEREGRGQAGRREEGEGHLQGKDQERG